MKSTAKLLAPVFMLAWALTAGGIRATAQQSLQGDRTGVYRPQPEIARGSLVRVPPEEVTPGLTYNYYNERLGRRAWGFAREDGSFQYAFGEGTMLPVDRFDLRLSPEAEEGLLEERSPGLQRRLSLTGGTPAVEMAADGQWRLLPMRVSERVFDLETGHRWEWHGGRRKGVVHTFGDQWQVVNGRYRPLGGGFSVAPPHCGTFHRAGSVVHLTRTPEPAW
jgi:hypothetical protein